MRIEPLNFRDFEPTATGGVVAVRRPHLPGGRRKEEAPPPPPPPPTFSEDQLKAAELESYKKGFTDGTAEGLNQAASEQAEIHRQLAETAEQFISLVSPLLADYRAMTLQLRQDLPKVALAIAKKVAGDALDQNAGIVVEQMAKSCMEAMIGEPRLAITVHSRLAPALEHTLQSLSARSQEAAHCIVTGDESMAVADCRIEWKYGAMERHTGALWQQVEQVVASMVSSAARTTEAQIAPLEQTLPPTHAKE